MVFLTIVSLAVYVFKVQSILQLPDQSVTTNKEKLVACLLNVNPSTAHSPFATRFARAQPHRLDASIASELKTNPMEDATLSSRGITVDSELKEAMANMLHARKPGLAEKKLFANDPSCKVWEDFSMYDSLSPIENLQSAAAIASKYVPKPFDGLGGALKAIEYWAKHAARTSFFVTNAVAGVAAFQFLGKGSKDQPGVDIGGGTEGGEIGLASGIQLVSSQILESMMVFEQDWQRIVKGKYAMPWDMADGHRQTSLPYALQQSARVIEETMGILERRTRASPEDRTIWMEAADNIYPEYYKTNYHYQTDGWMSRKSADVYETSTEVIFFGRQDAQQRTTLIPLHGLKRADGKPLKILEVACGTGRFGTFLRDNHPTADITYVDLSPFYLEAARENDDYWRKFQSERNGGKSFAPAKFVQAAAEALPFDAESFDVVVCVYLFHEMPEGPRAKAAAEMARVLASGGTLVLSDSIQRGDRPALDDMLVGFENLNEPHYRNYIQTSLASLFTPHGLRCKDKYLACTSKTLSFTKPEAKQVHAIR